jgi:hypothetical protein
MLYWSQQGQMFVTGETMRAGRNVQPLSYDVRLPDEAQADALRLLDASRAVVNALLACLWSRLTSLWVSGVDPPGNRWEP